MPLSQDQLDILRQNLNLAIIYSGNPYDTGNVIYPTWNPRGWKSYLAGTKDLADALERSGFQHVTLLAEGKHLRNELEKNHVDMAWLNCGGLQGYDGIGHTAALLESLGIPYVGHHPAHAMLLDNKYHFKMFATALGVPTAPFLYWDARKTDSSITEDPKFKKILLQQNPESQKHTFIVKPISGRASNHISFVDDLHQIDDTVLQLNRLTNDGALVETYLPGREFCISVTGGLRYYQGRLQPQEQSYNSPYCFSRLERILSKDEKIFTSMDIKPITRERIQPIDTAKDQDIVLELDTLIIRLYKALSLTAMVRADIRQDATGKLHLLEINPKPDLCNTNKSKGSLLALGLEQSKLSYDDLIVNQILYSIDTLLTYHELSSRKLHNLLTVTPNTACHALTAQHIQSS